MTLSDIASKLHKLIYDDRQLELEDLLRDSNFDEVFDALIEKDLHGNSTFHLAAMLGHAAILSQLFKHYLKRDLSKVQIENSNNQNNSSFSSCSPPPENTSSPPYDAKNSNSSNFQQKYVSLLGQLYQICLRLSNKNQWSPFEEAVARGHRPTISIFIRLVNLFQVAVALESSENLKKATKDKLLQKHDFQLKMKFDVRSWIPFVSKFLPKDEITLSHKDGSFRLDFHIMPGDGEPGQMLWKTGEYSAIFNKSQGQKYAVALDHTKRTGEWIISEHDGQNKRKKNQNKISSVKTLDLLLQQKGDIEDWLCACSEHPDVPQFLTHMLHIDNSEIGRQINMFMSKPVSRPGLSTHNVKFVPLKKSFGILGSGKTSTFGEYEAKNFDLAGLEIVVRSRNEHLSEEDKARHTKFKMLNNEFKNPNKTKQPQVQGPDSFFDDDLQWKIEIHSTPDNF